MGIIKDAFLAGLGFPRKPEPDPDYRDHPIPTRLQKAMRTVGEDDDRRKIVLAQSGDLNAAGGQNMEFVRMIRREFAAGNRKSLLSVNGTVRTPPDDIRAQCQSDMRIALQTLDVEGYTGGPPPNVACHDAIRTIVRLDAGLWHQPFGKRPTPPPAAPRVPIEDMVSVMVPKRDSGLLADIIRVRMAGGTPAVIDGSEMSAAARAVRYALACDSANGSGAAIDWLRSWSEGDPIAEKEMEAFENDGNG